jgi:hypothetical protein
MRRRKMNPALPLLHLQQALFGDPSLTMRKLMIAM